MKPFPTTTTSDTLRTSGRSRARRVAASIRGLAFEEVGSATAEYAIATMAAVGFAGVLVVILRGDEVHAMLGELIRRALTVQG